jgi:hypothetical protein
LGLVRGEPLGILEGADRLAPLRNVMKSRRLMLCSQVRDKASSDRNPAD